MLPDMAAYIAVFAGGETNALMMLPISMYSSHSLSVTYFDSSASVNMSSFICSTIIHYVCRRHCTLWR